MAIVKVNYLTLPKRAPAAVLKDRFRHLRRAADYYGGRPGLDVRPGESRRWLAYDGWPAGADDQGGSDRMVEHADARRLLHRWCSQALAGEHGREGGWRVYRVVLSAKDHLSEDDELADVLNTRFGGDRWLLVRHDGEEHPHAHALVLTRQRLTREHLQDLRGELWGYEEQQIQAHREEARAERAERQAEWARRREDRQREWDRQRAVREYYRLDRQLSRLHEAERRRALARQREIERAIRAECRRREWDRQRALRDAERTWRRLEWEREHALARDRRQQAQLDRERERAIEDARRREYAAERARAQERWRGQPGARQWDRGR